MSFIRDSNVLTKQEFSHHILCILSKFSGYLDELYFGCCSFRIFLRSNNFPWLSLCSHSQENCNPKKRDSERWGGFGSPDSTAMLSDTVLDLFLSLHQHFQRVSDVLAWIAVGICGSS